MIAHLVLFKLKAGIPRNDPDLLNLVAATAELPQQVKVIRGWEQGFNVTADEQACDYALRALFDSEADLHLYFDHPAHLPLLARWEALAEYVFADFPI